ncbi:MAG: hypothetical protein HYY40_13475 [Bacteroidetes bacterium]|nr:hypothetical protein [Bacteroidota bacterium]
MKNIYLPVLAITLFAFTSCKKKDDTNNDACGNKNFTASVSNGKSFESCNVISSMSTPYLQIHAQDNNGGTGDFQQIILQIPAQAFAAGTYTIATMDLQSTTCTGSYSLGSANNVQYTSDASATGTLTVSAYDGTAKKISGTFSFTGKKSYPTAGTETITVTSGSFTDITW